MSSMRVHVHRRSCGDNLRDRPPRTDEGTGSTPLWMTSGLVTELVAERTPSAPATESWPYEAAPAGRGALSVGKVPASRRRVNTAIHTVTSPGAERIVDVHSAETL